MKRATICGLFVATFIFAVALQSDARQEAGTAFDMTNAMIPMRDGVRLNTNIFVRISTDDRQRRLSRALPQKF